MKRVMFQFDFYIIRRIQLAMLSTSSKRIHHVILESTITSSSDETKGQRQSTVDMEITA